MSYVIVTPSFAGDFERCRLLAESVERFVPTAEHYVLVDDIDVALFQPLKSFGAHVVDARELMHPSLFRIPRTRLWLTRGGRVLRGWITQQMRKLAFAAVSPSENILCVDSDVVFVRPFDPDSKTRDGKTPLFEIDWCDAQNVKWANASRRLLGLPEQSSTRGYVHPTFWRRSAVQGLLAKLEQTQRRPWQLTLAKQFSFSEWVLYGTYVREVVGLDAAGMYSFNEPLMHLSWEYDLSDSQQLSKFVDDLADESVAAMFHSKDRVPPAAYADAVREIWARS